MEDFRPVPPALLDVFAITVANEREQRLLDEDVNVDWNGSAGRQAPLGWRHAYSLMSQLMMASHRKLDLILEHDCNLVQAAQNPRQRNAKIYRDGQRHILAGATQRLQLRLKSALIDSDIETDTASSSGALATLEAAMKLLNKMSLPNVHMHRSVSKALESHFGTSDTRVLREEGWEDGVWTLWMAVLAIWDQRHRQQQRTTAVPSLSDDDTDAHRLTPAANRIKSWLVFLTDRSTYGDPFGSDPLPARYYGSSHGLSDEVELQAMIEDLLPLFQHSDSKHTEALGLFVRKTWTVKLLRWAIVVVKQEGFFLDLAVIDGIPVTVQVDKNGNVQRVMLLEHEDE